MCSSKCKKCKCRCKCNLFTHGAPRSSKNSFKRGRAFPDRIGIWKFLLFWQVSFLFHWYRIMEKKAKLMMSWCSISSPSAAPKYGINLFVCQKNKTNVNLMWCEWVLYQQVLYFLCQVDNWKILPGGIVHLYKRDDTTSYSPYCFSLRNPEQLH